MRKAFDCSHHMLATKANGRWLMNATAVHLPFLIPAGCFAIGLARCFLAAGPKKTWQLQIK